MAEEIEDANGKKKPAGKFSDPCLLIDYIGEFAKKSVEEFNVTGWSNFKTIDVTNSATTPADIISSMTSRGGIDEFLNMDNTTLGLMVPKVKLFKQYYKNEQDTVGHSIEYLFDDSFDGDRIDAMTLGGLQRSGGAGIKDVSWEFNGTNPAEADRVINVTLKLVFQSAYDLLGDRYDPATGNILAIDPEIDFVQDGVQYTKNYVDLILHPPGRTEAFGGKSMEDEVGNKYVPKFYRLKMIVGWAVPDGVFPNLINEPNQVYVDGQSPKSKTEKLKEELTAMELSIFLNLVSHQLDIRENGQIELSIDYIGSFEETINGNAANVLNPDASAEEEVKSANEVREDAESKRKSLREIQNYIDCLDLSDDANKTEVEKLQKVIKDTTEDIKGLVEEAEQFDDNSKSIIYNRFLNHMSRRVKRFELTEKQAKEWEESLDTGVRPRFQDMIGSIKIAGENGENYFAAETEEERAALDLGDETGFFGDTQEEQLNEVIDQKKEALENYTVNFVYLGDILNVACKMARSQNNNQVDSRMKILTGPVMITHPRALGNKGRKILINLADIPVSYDEFQLFFFETVVRKELASYPLRSFIKDVLERLVSRILQPRECFAKGREQRSVDIGMTNFTIRSSVAEQMNMDGNQRMGRFSMDKTTFNNQNPTPSDPNSDFDCMLLYMTSYASYDLVGNELEDRSRGIYHYYIGAERGLIQKIEFSRSDVQGLREARQAESRNLGQIRDVYNANVRMIGNTLYIPGMKVFLNPPVGFGRPETGTKKPDEATGKQGMYGSLSNLLGIGGYYDVIKVQSSISRGSVFSTELDCVFAQSGGESDKLKSLCEDVDYQPALDALGAEIAGTSTKKEFDARTHHDWKYR